MSKLSTKFVILILAAGIVIGAATTATIISAGIKPSNFALAQVRLPFQTQPPVKDPLQQPAGRALNCVGCVITKNLANGAVTNPKLATPSVQSANIGAGQVMTPNIADQAITTPKIAAGAVSIHPQIALSDVLDLSGKTSGIVTADCPPGTFITGGGYQEQAPPPTNDFKVWENVPTIGVGGVGLPNSGWIVAGYSISGNPLPHGSALVAHATCASLTP